jgi:hypothetical protein
VASRRDALAARHGTRDLAAALRAIGGLALFGDGFGSPGSHHRRGSEDADQGSFCKHGRSSASGFQLASIAIVPQSLFWHKADILVAPINVAFGAIAAFLRNSEMLYLEFGKTHETT